MEFISQDTAVQATNDEASICKLSAIQLGYWIDPYISLFVRSLEKKSPEINRGYYARVFAIQALLEQFLNKVEQPSQILNFGAGYDTLYWKLKEANRIFAKYVEIDFPTVTSKKCHYIKRHNRLLNIINSEDNRITFEANDMHSKDYCIVGCDIQNLPLLQSKISKLELDSKIPTLIIFECVLVYMDLKATQNLLRWLSSIFSTLYVINYEQVNMEDKFGEIMIKNLQNRGCYLNGVEACQTLEKQKQRFLETGYDGSFCWTMHAIYLKLDKIEISRIEKIEFLDERELLDQLLNHYCICVGWKDVFNLGLKNIQFNEISTTI